MLLCSIAHSIICTRLFRGKMHSDWFNGKDVLQGRWQHGEKVGYCYPSGLEKTLCKWDICVPLGTKGLKSRTSVTHRTLRQYSQLQKLHSSSVCQNVARAAHSCWNRHDAIIEPSTGSSASHANGQLCTDGPMELQDAGETHFATT
jgi:hypothetical protein